MSLHYDSIPPPPRPGGRARPALALCLAAALTVGCRSTGGGEARARNLPYHVAVSVASDDVYVDETPKDADRSGAQVDLGHFASARAGEDRVDFPLMIADRLQAEVFSKVTLLAQSPIEAVQVAQAKASGADLFMTVRELAYDTRAESKPRYSNWFWFFTGPFEFLFNDREFKVEGTVEVELYDLNQVPDPLGLAPAQLASGVAGLGAEEAAALMAYTLPAEALVRRFRAQPDWAKTKFQDRAQNGFDWVKSIFLPSSFLRTDGREARRYVAEKSFASLAATLSRQIAVDAEFVARPSHTDRMYIESALQGGQIRTALDEQRSEVLFEAIVLQREDSAESDFRVAEVRLGERVFDLSDAQGRSVLRDGFRGSIGVQDASDAPAGWVRKRIEVALPVAATYVGRAGDRIQVDPTLQLVLADELGAGQSRSWTFDLGAEERGMVRAIEAGLARGETIVPRGGAFRTTEPRTLEGGY